MFLHGNLAFPPRWAADSILQRLPAVIGFDSLICDAPDGRFLNPAILEA